ncbi:MAG: class I SAM-dependent methyltransferase [Saccharospirillum sp.]
MAKRLHNRLNHWLRGEVPNARVQERALQEWYGSPIGQKLVDTERALVARGLSGRFGAHMVQLDTGLYDPLFEQRLYGCGALVTQLDNQAACPVVRADPEALPFEPESVDAVLMHHTLDQCENPYQALREAAMVLRPGGLMVVIGFNPFSLWGLRAFLARPAQGVWRSRFLRSGRVADWMQLLNFELERYEKHYFSLPFNCPEWVRHLGFLGRAQRFMMPATGAVYLLVGCKQVAGRINGRVRFRAPSVLDAPLANRIVRSPYDGD